VRAAEAGHLLSRLRAEAEVERRPAARLYAGWQTRAAPSTAREITASRLAQRIVRMTGVVLAKAIRLVLLLRRLVAVRKDVVLRLLLRLLRLGRRRRCRRRNKEGLRRVAERGDDLAQRTERLLLGAAHRQVQRKVVLLKPVLHDGGGERALVLP
jgi:hypothetical protein